MKKEEGSVVCGDERHREKVFFCKKFKELKLAETMNAIKKLGACKRCLGCHKEWLFRQLPVQKQRMQKGEPVRSPLSPLPRRRIQKEWGRQRWKTQQEKSKAYGRTRKING